MNMDEVLQVFIAESQELLQQMEEALLQLENDPDDADTINAIFRAAHTIKGSCSNFGATGLAHVSMEMEKQGKVADFAGAAATLPALKTEFGLVTQALQQYR